MSELNELRKKAREAKDANLARIRGLYQYARSLGFTSSEARLLSFTSKAKVDRLANLKDKSKERR